ncbi:MAG: hypothetical protein QM774_11130 [Gordonia sp. (in: high G+C Gram-positive bacteria)]|uniref:hypothetical protein n=1 Tax=Gordonia sp. (in: high G+C Gram-positive bacteria) TaxID=84139 RepID=UPI0039E70B7D
MKRPLFVLAVSGVLLVAGCGSGGSGEPTTPVSSPTVAATSAESAPSTEGYSTALDPEQGGAGNGSTWSFGVPQIGNGEKPVRDSFNQAMSDAADALVSGASTRKVLLEDGELSAGERSRVDVADSTFSGTLIVRSTEDGKDPVLSVSTTVVDAGSGKRLSLGDLFSDPSATVGRLRALLRQRDPSGVLAAAAGDESSLSRWVALPQGLHVYVPVTHAQGDFVPITVPWASLSDLLNPTGRLYFLPDS